MYDAVKTLILSVGVPAACYWYFSKVLRNPVCVVRHAEGAAWNITIDAPSRPKIPTQKRMKELPFVIRSLGKRCCTTAICYPPFSDEPTCSLFKPPHMVVVHTMIPCQSILDHQHAPIEGNMHDWSRLTGARRTRARRQTEVSCCSCRRGMRQTTPIRPSPTACWREDRLKVGRDRRSGSIWVTRQLTLGCETSGSHGLRNSSKPL